MNIEVKGMNDVLIMKCNESVLFDELLQDLNKLLDQPIFHQDSYYPRAFFDFGCRHLNNDDITCLISLLKEKKKVLFSGMSLPHDTHCIEMKKEQVHNGEEIEVFQETLFLGTINSGGCVYCYDNVYFLNEVKGTIIAMNEDVKIYGHQFTHAQIIINRKILHDLTTSAFVSLYYKDNQIVCNEEDDYDKNHCFHFR